MKYAIQQWRTGEFLRDGHKDGDAYTDDLGQALIFDDLRLANIEVSRSSDEKIVDVIEGEDGGLSLREDKEDGS